ncbi:hypothetical protein ACSW9I_06105 [Clostridium perfringens]|uniref:hypothetical protein n=1 Tax=Clostridium perfringens TaxID=1502 RepID=UPI0024BC1B53|nr:hypothetical protein [Clostridium perfringens]
MNKHEILFITLTEEEKDILVEKIYNKDLEPFVKRNFNKQQIKELLFKGER